MTLRIQQARTVKSLLACILTLTVPMMAADQPVPADSSESRPAPSEIELLKKMLLDQQRQIDELRQQLAGAKPEQPVIVHQSIGEVASTTPILPPVPAPAPMPTYSPSPSAAPVPQAGSNVVE